MAVVYKYTSCTNHLVRKCGSVITVPSIYTWFAKCADCYN